MNAATKTADPVEFPSSASEVLDRSISIHRAAIRRNTERLQRIQADRSEAVARIDDELFEAERTFIELRARLTKERAEFCDRADKEIAALTRLTAASKLALSELLSEEGARHAGT